MRSPQQRPPPPPPAPHAARQPAAVVPPPRSGKGRWGHTSNGSWQDIRVGAGTGSMERTLPQARVRSVVANGMATTCRLITLPRPPTNSGTSQKCAHTRVCGHLLAHKSSDPPQGRLRALALIRQAAHKQFLLHRVLGLPPPRGRKHAHAHTAGRSRGCRRGRGEKHTTHGHTRQGGGGYATSTTYCQVLTHTHAPLGTLTRGSASATRIHTQHLHAGQQKRAHETQARPASFYRCKRVGPSEQP